MPTWLIILAAVAGLLLYTALRGLIGRNRW